MAGSDAQQNRTAVGQDPVKRYREKMSDLGWRYFGALTSGNPMMMVSKSADVMTGVAKANRELFRSR